MSFQGKVIAKHNNLPLRMHATPFLEARVVSKLPIGVIVDIEAVEGSWMCVYDRATGYVGWVAREYIQELPLPQPDVSPAPIDTTIVDFWHKAWTVVLGILAFAVTAALALGGWLSR